MYPGDTGKGLHWKVGGLRKEESLNNLIFILWKFHVCIQCILITSTPPPGPPSSPHHISFPVLCLPFWSILTHWVMLAQSISAWVWSYLQRRGELASSYTPEEKWVSFPKQQPAADSSSALGVTLWNPSLFHGWHFNWLDLMWVLCRWPQVPWDWECSSWAVSRGETFPEFPVIFHSFFSIFCVSEGCDIDVLCLSSQSHWFPACRRVVHVIPQLRR